jgi:outer membrane cobalamin receptor
MYFEKREVTKKMAVTVAASILLYASQVWAAEATVFQLDQVTVTAERITQTIGNTPASVTVITGAELANKGARTLADALIGVSGINVQSYGGTGQKSIPFILGTDRW